MRIPSNITQQIRAKVGQEPKCLEGQFYWLTVTLVLQTEGIWGLV